jgi:histidinol dehydrogenase
MTACLPRSPCPRHRRHGADSEGVRSAWVLPHRLTGVDRVYTVGGAQAIAALAYGTQTIARVDKIVGPGGAFVAAAKRLVFGPVGIDSIAGPSEILVIADGSAPAEWIALDLFSQAEHDEAAQAILLCPDDAYIAEVDAAMSRLFGTLDRRDVIARSLAPAVR